MKICMKIMLLLFVAGLAHAQTVEQVASEVDQVEVDLASVNSKADSAKGKADANESRTLGVEQRVTNLENAPPPVGYDDTALQSQVTVNDGRLVTLETSTPNQSQVDANSSALAAAEARIAALEAAGPPPTSSGPKFVVRDAASQVVGEWSERNLVGQGFFTLPSGKPLSCQVDAETVTFITREPAQGMLYLKSNCDPAWDQRIIVVHDLTNNVPLYAPLPQSFIGEEEGFIWNGGLYVPNLANTWDSNARTVYKINPINGLCVERAFGNPSANKRYAHYKLEATLPNLIPPFTMTEE